MKKTGKLENLVFTGFLIALVIVIISSLINVFIFNGLKNHIYDIGDVRMPSIKGLDMILLGLVDLRKAQGLLTKQVVIDDLQSFNENFQIIERANKQIKDGWEIYEPLPQTEEEAKLWKAFLAEYESWKKENDIITAKIEALRGLILARNSEQIKIVKSEADSLFPAENVKATAMRKALDQVINLNYEVAEQEKRASKKSSSFGNSFAIGSMLLMIAFILATALFFRKRVMGIRLASEAAQDYTERVLKSIVAPMFMTDKDLKIVSVNKAFLDVIGYTEEEVVGKMQCADLCKTPVCGTSDCTLKKSMQSGQPIIAETFATTKNGRKLPILAQCNAIFDADHKPLGGTEVWADLTIQKETIAQVNKVIQHAVKGDLNQRADSSNSTGDYRIILENINTLMDKINELISETSQALEKMANKDLSIRITNEFDGIFKKLTDNTNQTAINFERAFSIINENINQLESAAGQLSQSSQQLSQSTSEQSSAFEEISSSLEELDSMSKHNNESAINGKNISIELMNLSSEVKSTMDELQKALIFVKEASEKTFAIIKTIDEIAFQTNILALNAAVEAARAGDAGRGFAVVAEEVRALAQRSAEAAKQTTQIINESKQFSESAAMKGSAALDASNRLIKEIERIKSISEEIAAASKEQEKGVEQINQAMQQANTATQQIAANSEELASAAEELSSQSEELKRLTMEFTLSHNLETSEPTLTAVKQKAIPKTTAAQNKTVSKMVAKKAIHKDTRLSPSEVIPLDEDNLKGF